MELLYIADVLSSAAKLKMGTWVRPFTGGSILLHVASLRCC